MRWVFLIVTATAGFRHESIEVAEQVLAQLAASRGLEIVFARTEEERRTRLTPDALRGIDATSRDAYDTFRRDHADDYARVDGECESLTLSEESLGQFELI